jgi:hypothetical protein
VIQDVLRRLEIRDLTARQLLGVTAGTAGICMVVGVSAFEGLGRQLIRNWQSSQLRFATQRRRSTVGRLKGIVKLRDRSRKMAR